MTVSCWYRSGMCSTVLYAAHWSDTIGFGLSFRLVASLRLLVGGDDANQKPAFIVQYVQLTDNDERYLFTSLMQSLRSPCRVGCIQLYRELERCRCSTSFLLNLEENKIGWFTQLTGRQMVPSIVKRPGEYILIKNGRKLKR